MLKACPRHDALGPSGTGKTHVALGLGLAACQKGMSVSFTTAAALVNALMEARDERRLLRVTKQMAGVKLPSSGVRGRTGATVPRRYRRVGLRAAVQDRRRVAVRNDLTALRARCHVQHQHPAIR